MDIACPACQLTIDVRRSKFGMRINCPGCGESFRVPAEQEGAELAEVFLTDEDSPGALPNPQPSRPKSERPLTKTCPMCGEKEEADARRCRYCGETLAGFQGADGYAIEGVWREGNKLVMTKQAMLPAICVQTNQPTAERLRRRLYWHNPWIYLLFFTCGLVVYVIVALVVRQSADIKIGLCRERIVRRRWIIFWAWMGALAAIGLFIAGVAAGEKNMNSNLSPILCIGALVTFLGSLITGSILARIVTPAKITTRYVWLKGVHPEYLAALPAFPGEQ
jgi:hypothetical protein